MIHIRFGRRSAVFRNMTRRFATVAGDRRGNIAAVFALLLVPLVGIMSVASETSSWFLFHHAMQSTTDAAVLAAASNGDAGGGNTNYQQEAKAVASNLGFTNGSNNTTVTANYLTSGCPSGAANCYKVAISRCVPLYLVEVVGYNGTGTPCTTDQQLIQATSYASAAVAGQNFCALALDPTGTAISQTSGTMNLNGCGVWVDSKSTNPSAFNQSGGIFVATEVDAEGKISGNNIQGTVNQNDTGTPPQDPYAGIYSTNNVSSLISQPCPSGNKNVSVGTGQTKSILQGVYCGNLQVNGGTLNLASGVYIFQGVNFTTNGTISGSGVTIIMTCATPPCTGSSSNWSSLSQNGGAMNLSAPTSGSWSGLLYYQDPNQPVCGSCLGSPEFKITSGTNTLQGALYFPTQGVGYTNGTANSQCIHIVAWAISFSAGTMNSSCGGVGVANIGTSSQRQALLQ